MEFLQTDEKLIHLIKRRNLSKGRINNTTLYLMKYMNY